MPNYLVELEDGRKFQVEADSPPTSDDLTQYFSAQQPVATEKPFLDISETASALGRAATSLATTVPSSLSQAWSGLDNPWKRSEGYLQSQQGMRDLQEELDQSEREAELSGDASTVSSTIREAIPSLGFSGATLLPSLGAGAGALALTKSPNAARGAAAATSAIMAYRMAGAQFLDDAKERIDAYFQENLGRLPNEQEQNEAYDELLPLARKFGAAEAGPEALGNLALGGAGKYIRRALGGKGGVIELASNALGKVTGTKAVLAGAGALASEIGTEAVTAVEQDRINKQFEEGIMRGESPESVQLADRSPQDYVEGFKDVAPTTTALTAMMGAAGLAPTAISRGIRSLRKPQVEAAETVEEQMPPPPVDPGIQAARDLVTPTANVEGAQANAELAKKQIDEANELAKNAVAAIEGMPPPPTEPAVPPVKTAEAVEAEVTLNRVEQINSQKQNLDQKAQQLGFANARALNLAKLTSTDVSDQEREVLEEYGNLNKEIKELSWKDAVNLPESDFDVWSKTRFTPEIKSDVDLNGMGQLYLTLSGRGEAEKATQVLQKIQSSKRKANWTVAEWSQRFPDDATSQEELNSLNQQNQEWNDGIDSMLSILQEQTSPEVTPYEPTTDTRPEILPENLPNLEGDPFAEEETPVSEQITPLSEGAERNRAIIAEAAAKLRGEAPQTISAGLQAAIPQQAPQEIGRTRYQEAIDSGLDARTASAIGAAAELKSMFEEMRSRTPEQIKADRMQSYEDGLSKLPSGYSLHGSLIEKFIPSGGQQVLLKRAKSGVEVIAGDPTWVPQGEKVPKQIKKGKVLAKYPSLEDFIDSVYGKPTTPQENALPVEITDTESPRQEPQDRVEGREAEGAGARDQLRSSAAGEEEVKGLQLAFRGETAPQVQQDIQTISDYEASQPPSMVLTLSQSVLTPEKASKLSDSRLIGYLKFGAESIAAYQKQPSTTPLQFAQESATRLTLTSAMAEGQKRKLPVADIMEKELEKRLAQPITPSGTPTPATEGMPTLGNVGKRDATKPEQMTPEERDEAWKRSSAAKEREAASESIPAEDLGKIQEVAQKQLSGYIKTLGVAGAGSTVEMKAWSRFSNGIRKAISSLSLGQSYPMQRVYSQARHARHVSAEAMNKQPVSSAAVDSYGITLPEGYVKQGDLYVFQPKEFTSGGKQPLQTGSGTGTTRQLQAGKERGETKALESEGISASAGEYVTEDEARTGFQIAVGTLDKGAVAPDSPAILISEKLSKDSYAVKAIYSFPNSVRGVLTQIHLGLPVSVEGDNTPRAFQIASEAPKFFPLAKNYTRQGDLYVFQPGATGEPVQAAPSAAQAVKATAPGPVSFTKPKGKKWNWEATDEIGGTAYGNLKKGEADIIGMESVPRSKKYTEEEPRFKRRGFLRGLIQGLREKGAKTLRVSMQSEDTRAALARLVEKGELTNPREMRGISVDEYPTVFDIPQTATVATQTETAAPSAKGAAVASGAERQPSGGSIPEVAPSETQETQPSTKENDAIAKIDRLVSSGAKPEEMDKFVKSLSDDEFNALVESEAFEVDTKLAIKPKDTYDAKRIKRRKFVDQINATAVQARKTAEQIFKEEEAALERQRKMDERTKTSLNSIIDPEKTNIVQGTVSAADAESARRALNNSGEIPNAFLTRIYASPEAFLADRANQRYFPSSYARLQSESNIEGLFERGQTLIFADKIGVSDLDRRIGKNLGISPEQAAARRVIAHENGHRSVALFTANEKREFLSYLRRKYNDAQIDNLVRVYSEYADWRTNLESRNEALEELFLKDFERLEKIPTGGIWDDIVQFLKRVWRRLTGRTDDPTLQDMKDVVRLLRNAMRRTAVPSFTTKDGGEVKLSLSDRFQGVTPAQDAEYLAAVEAGDMEKVQRMVDEAAKAANPDSLFVDAGETQTDKLRWMRDADAQIAFYKKQIASLPTDEQVELQYQRVKESAAKFFKNPDAPTVDEIIGAIQAGVSVPRGTLADALRERDMERANGEKEIAKYEAQKLRAPKGGEETAFKTGQPTLTKVFHATPFGRLDSFDDDMLGGFTGAPSAKMAHFFAGSSKVAETYFADHGWILDQKGFFRLSADQKKELVSAVREELGDNPSDQEVANLAEELFDTEYDASKIQNELHEVFVNLRNPLVYDFKGEGYRDVSFRELLEKAEAEGHDGVVMANTYDAGPASQLDDKGESTNIVAVLRGHARQIKSADPVTYDDAGNVIPLSQRFQAASPDIRFSRVEYASDHSAAVSAGSQLARDTVYDDRIIEMRDAIRRAYEQSNTEAGVAMPLDELYAKAKELAPDMTENEFGNILQDLYEDNGAVLQEGESAFDVFTPEGRRAGFAVIMPKRSVASRVEMEGEAVKSYQDGLEAIESNMFTAKFGGRKTKGVEPTRQTIKPNFFYKQASIQLVDDLLKDKYSIEDIANSLMSDEFLQDIGIKNNVPAIVSLTAEVKNRLSNEARSEKDLKRKVALEKLFRKLTGFDEGVGNNAGRGLGIRSYITRDPRYRWMYIYSKAEEQLRKDRELAATRVASDLPQTADNLQKTDVKIAEETDEQVADDLEDNQDAIDLAEGEATLDQKGKTLWEKFKDLIRKRGIAMRALNALRAGNKAKASISSEERNAISQMSEEELVKFIAGIDKEMAGVFDEFTKTPATRKKREKMIATAKKRAEQGKPIEPKQESEEDEVSRAERTAQNILKDLSERYADPVIYKDGKRPNINEMRELYKQRVKQGVGPTQMSEEAFVKKAVELGADELTAGILWKAAELEIDAREAMRQEKVLDRQRAAGERADAEAQRIIFAKERLKRQSGFAGIERSANKDTIIKAFKDQVETPVEQDEFTRRLLALKVSRDVAGRLFRAAAREKADLKAMEAFRRLEGPNALQIMQREISALRPGEQAPFSKQIPWRKLLSQKASTVEIYRQRIFDTISSEESFSDLDDAQKAKLADLLTQAWESKRKQILDRMVDNAINQEQAAGRLTREGADALRSQRQKLVEDINLGILDEDRLMKHLADKFGIKSEFTEDERANIDRLLDILQDDKLNEVKRNKAAYELLEALSSATKIPLAKLLADYWVSSVLSGVNTAASIAMAVASGAYELTTGAFRILRAGFTNPKELPAEIAASFKAMAEFLKAFGREGRLAWQYLVTGDRAFLDPSMNTVLNDLNYDSIGKTVSLAEKMAKSDKILQRVMGIWMRSVSRLLTALDSFNSGVTKAGALPIVFRQLNLDAESLKQATEKYNLQLYRDRVIERDFNRNKPTTAHDKALVDSYAKAEMMADLQEFGKFSENADFFGQQGAMTLDPTGVGGFIYSSIKSLTGGATNRADKFLAEAEREWKQADGTNKTAKGLQLALAYFLQFGAYNSANLAGLRFARFAGNKFNQGLSFIPGIGMFRMYEATAKDSKIEAKDAFIDMIMRNQTAGILFAIIGGMALKAITDEPDDEKRGFFWNGGWANLTPERKQQKLAAGQKEYTIGIPGVIAFNYQNWPISPIMAAIGSLSDLIRFSPEQWNEKAMADRIVSAAASGVFSAGEIPALSGFQTLFGNNLSSKDPNEKRLDRFAKVMAGWGGGFVPRILKDIDFMADPGLRKYETLWAQTASHIPVYRRHIGEEYYDILGKQIERKVWPGSREFMELETDPEYRTLGKLNSRGIWLTPANAEHRMVGKGRFKRKLTQEEADAYSLETGKGYRQMLLRYGGRLEQMPTERARAFLMDKADEVRDRALKKIVR